MTTERERERESGHSGSSVTLADGPMHIANGVCDTG